MCNEQTCIMNRWMSKTCTTNVQTMETCTMNIQMVRTYAQLNQMTNPVSTQATQIHMMTILPNKQYETHTNIKLHGTTVHTMLLARSFQDHASPSKFGKIHQCGTTQFIFYFGGTDPCSPAPHKVRNRIVKLLNTMFSHV